MDNNTYLNWQYILRDSVQNAINDDFVIFDSTALDDIPDAPFKANATTAILCQCGELQGSISLQSFVAKAPCLVVLLADRILELQSASEDFRGQILVMSKHFTDNLLTDLHERLPLTMSVERHPCRPLDEESMVSMENYFSMMKKAASMTDNPNRLEVARHLMLAFMYGLRSYFHPDAEEKMSHMELLAERFITLVKRDYRRERQLKYYANKLCLSPKHIAKVIKETTGKSCNEWIDDHVILEAKAMLKSSDMTIQQISNELNFDNQSFFAKYFKRHLGITPKEYRYGNNG